jgi:hypothetical protein
VTVSAVHILRALHKYLLENGFFLSEWSVPGSGFLSR